MFIPLTCRLMLCLPLLAGFCLAQGSGASGQEKAAQEKGAEAIAAKGPGVQVSLSFAGGTMAQFVAAVRKAEPKVNIVVSDSVAAVAVPALEVSDAELGQLLESVCEASSSVGDTGMLLRCGGQKLRSADRATVYSITGRWNNRASLDPVETIVLSLNRLTSDDPLNDIKGIEIDTILSAIEASSHFDEEGPKMRYHKDSGLLFLHGSVRQLKRARDVLVTLEEDQDVRVRLAEQLKRQLRAAGRSGASAGDKQGR